MKKLGIVLLFITAIVAAEWGARVWLRKNSVDYLIQNYPSTFDGVPAMKPQAQFIGREGWIATDDYGFVGNSSEAYKATPKVAVFGGWSGVGLSTHMGRSFPEMLKFFFKATKNSEVLPTYTVVNFSEGGHCIESLVTRIEKMAAEWALDTVLVLVTPDLYLPCVRESSDVSDFLKPFAAYYLWRKLTGQTKLWSPETSFKEVMTSGRFVEVRDHLSRLRTQIAPKKNIDVIPVIGGFPQDERSTDFEIFVFNDLSDLGFEPIYVSRWGPPQFIEGAFSGVFMPTASGSQAFADAIVKGMLLRGIR